MKLKYSADYEKGNRPICPFRELDTQIGVGSERCTRCSQNKGHCYSEDGAFVECSFLEAVTRKAYSLELIR